MANVGFIEAGSSWGPAEQKAIDRCLALPGLTGPPVSRTPHRLSRTIETEIIPRLMLAHLGEGDDGPALSRPELLPSDVGDFARIILERDVPTALGQVETVRAKGHTLEAVFLDLLAPTARLLGDMWAADLCSFTDVTIGLSRLQQVLRDLGPSFENETRRTVRGRILLAAAPGEQHSFGLSMLESFFRRAGWDVFGGAAYSRGELLRLARDEWLDAIGLSLSSDVLYEPIRALIPALREASRNRAVLVMVGGRYFSDNPDHATLIGADVAASDAPDALRRADACLGLSLASC